VTLVAVLLLATLAAAQEGTPTFLIQSVVPDSAAASAGARDGDYIVSLDGTKLVVPDDLQSVVGKHRPGDTVPLVIQRDGKQVELDLTFGERPDGGASLGVRLEISAEPSAGGDPTEGTAKCLSWIDDTYDIGRLLEQLDLEFAEDLEVARACVERDTQRMYTTDAIRYCDNVFKVHCAGLDLLAEIGETLVDRCEGWVAESTGLNPKEQSAWTTCTERKIFERYSKEGKAADRQTCLATFLEECGGGEKVSSWTQWGGPNRDFQAPASSLAATWPEQGPETLWDRELGDGYSAILVEHGRLYTMYRSGKNEVAVCLDAGTGETIWEHAYEQSPHERHLSGYGDGPRATPLIAGDLLFTVGVAGTMHALKKENGEVVWSRDLWGDDFGGSFQVHGYGSSPLAYEGTVIVQIGGEQGSLVAFAQDDGSVKWKAHDLRNSHSSPRLVDIAGERQLLVFMANELIGVDPDTGSLRWSYAHANQWGHNINMPAVVDGDTIFLSSPQTGARGLKLVPDGDTIRVEEIWSSRRVQFYHVSSVRDGDWIYGSSGMMSPAFMTAVNVRSGDIGWRERGIAKANCVAADGKLVILDEDGMLYLAGATPQEFVVHSRTQLFDGVSWTVPTIVGKTLYVRDTQRIVALDLG
jgi:outer membrane protein assembly factor BamB